jgi:5-methylcytosine-specific restriction endonuclease McrA
MGQRLEQNRAHLAMPQAVCLEPGCPQPADYRGRCQTHATQRDRNIQRAGHHIYRTKRWRITRNHHLAQHPLCDCGRIATDVHHRIDIADGGPPWAPTNLASLCHACHGKITRRRQTA